MTYDEPDAGRRCQPTLTNEYVARLASRWLDELPAGSLVGRACERESDGGEREREREIDIEQ